MLRGAWSFLGMGYGLSWGYGIVVWWVVVAVLPSMIGQGGCSISVAEVPFMFEGYCISVVRLLCVWLLVYPFGTGVKCSSDVCGVEFQLSLCIGKTLLDNCLILV
eukprot:scaffold26915_cov71-Attheya_sp.AAC.3